eukprot:1159858-Pelagomonas_calceolata.AAC.14
MNGGSNKGPCQAGVQTAGASSVLALSTATCSASDAAVHCIPSTTAAQVPHIYLPSAINANSVGSIYSSL